MKPAEIRNGMEYFSLRSRSGLLAFAVMLCMLSPAFGATIYVPDDQPTIQTAISVALQGDTIIVRPGTYVENLDFLGKSLTLQSEQGPEATIIDGGNPVNPELKSVVLIRGSQGSDLVLDGFTITNGLAMYGNEEGSAILCDGASPVIRNNVISRNEYHINSGGITCLNGASPLIENNVIESNLGNAGGGIYCNDGSPTIRDNVIRDNVVDSAGGGLYLLGGSPVLTGNTITGNEARSPYHIEGFAGGLYCYESAAVISGCVFSKNTASMDAGGAIFVRSAAVISQCTFDSNEAGAPGNYPKGGGILCTGDPWPAFTDCVISNNRCSKGGGGGLYLKGNYSYGDFLLSGCSIIGNSAYGHGGGIFVEADLEGTITGCTIGRNTARHSGGGLYHSGSYISLNVANCLFYSNSAELDGGGICSSGDLVVAGSTIAANEAAYFGGGIYCDSFATLAMHNCIVWDNDAPAWPEVYTSPGVTEISHSDIGGGYAGAGNIDADPLFADPGRGDFHLPFDSPCKDAGCNALVPAGITTDVEGDPRIYQGTVDMGSDECHPHLYALGEIVPGASIEVKVIGLPDAPAVSLILGSGVLDPPRRTIYGDLFLEKPFRALFFAGKMPANGILSYPGVVPASWSSGEGHPLQALVGPRNGPLTRLTNLMILEVE